ncbi:MAG: cupin domain-containing protein [Bacteroidetes bacterium]|nr:MAG: cupin domain-containing protein [Bacteroidota bacterium]
MLVEDCLRKLKSILYHCPKNINNNLVPASLDTLSPAENYENIYIKKMANSPNSTSFVIWIKKGVKLHKHRLHTETLYVLEGEGEMTVGPKTFKIKKGDFFTVPRDTPHKVMVTSKVPLKVISIQAPKFMGKDRIMLE